MKWVAITLLLLNGVFLAVHLNMPGQAEQVIERFPFSGPRLELLTEKEERDKARLLAEKNRQQQLVEAEPASLEPAVTVIKKPVVPAKSGSTALACYSVGPFLLSSDVKNVSQWFVQADIPIQERSELQRNKVGYWLYIPPLATLQQAQLVLKNINEVNAQIIAEGTKANAISVGVYKNEAQGTEQQKRLADKGYQVRLEPLFRTQTQYWLDLELMSATQIPEKLWHEISASYPRINQLRRKCD